mgnify:FL=1
MPILCDSGPGRAGPKEVGREQISLESLPRGSAKYVSMAFAHTCLPPIVMDVLSKMAHDIPSPRITYRCHDLQQGEHFGHGKFHRDGLACPQEVHCLLIIGEAPTLGEEGFIMSPGIVWEYSGTYLHRTCPAPSAGPRLMLRVSKTNKGFINNWSFYTATGRTKNQT